MHVGLLSSAYKIGLNVNISSLLTTAHPEKRSYDHIGDFLVRGD